MAVCLAAWMGTNTLGAGNLPPGCGEGAGCAEVLGSPWSRWFGIPVVWGAVALYSALALGLLARKPTPCVFFATTALGAALWFVILQAVVVKAFCLFCMIDHTLGALAAVLALTWARPRGGPILLGAAAVLVFAGLHALQPQRIHLLRAPGDGDADFRAADGRRGLALLDGAFVLDVSASPRIGHPEARQVLAVLVDYACPHCRGLHHDLAEQQRQFPDDLAFLVLPTPIHPDCNPHIGDAPERFRHSCTITLLSLGLFHTRPELWSDFDAWLFEPSMPRDLEETRAQLQGLGLDPDALMALPAARADLERNVALFAALPVDDPRERRVPVLLAAGHPPLIGPAGRIDRLPHLTPMTSPP